MNAERDGQLLVVAETIRRFELGSLYPALRACESLIGEEPINLVVLGQFNSGKSSLLNAVLGEAIFPVGVLPVTAIITRASAGPERVVRVTHLDGAVEEVPSSRLAEFVTEAGNVENRRQVALVDIVTPTLREWPGVRFVDTPGLGSALTHNSQATRSWMPNVAVALVTVSSERPLSDEDCRLIADARQTAPRVVVVLTKVDLLTADELTEVVAFLERALCERFGVDVPVLPLSSRVEPERWVRPLRDAVMLPVVGNVAAARAAAVSLKLGSLVRACRSYLTVGLEAAVRADEDRQRLRAAVLNESVSAALTRDELLLAEQRVSAAIRPAFEQCFQAQRVTMERRLGVDLAAELRTWRGNLAQQARRYEAWMTGRLIAELTPLSETAASLAVVFLGQAENRFRRIVEAFRDRLNRNIQEAMGVIVAPLAWEAKPPKLVVIPVALSSTFMTHWDLLWWLLPMKLVGALFRRHVLGRVPWEVEKNLARLAADWSAAGNAAVSDLRTQAEVWSAAEVATLDSLLKQRPAEAAAFRQGLHRLEGAAPPCHRQPENG